MSLTLLPSAYEALQGKARHKAFYGGRGGGKSHSFAETLVLEGYKREDFRWLFAREIQNSLAASVKQLLEDKIKKLGLGHEADGGNGYYRITDRSIKGRNGRIEFLFAGLRTNSDSVRSMEGLDGAWVEEANTISQRSIDLLIPTVRKEGSELWWSWNRTDIEDPVDKLFLGGEPPPFSIVKNVNWCHNPWFPETLRIQKDWDHRRDIDKWRHVWEGEPISHSEARVFKNWRIDDLDDRITKQHVPRLGADWGFSVDPSSLICCYLLEPKTLYIKSEAWAMHLEVDHTPAFWAGCDERWINPLGFEGLAESRNNQIVADSARPETISYMKRRGFDVIKSRKGPGSIVEGVNFIKSYDVVLHPKCIHAIDEFKYYSYNIDTKTGRVLNTLKDRKNHAIDPIRYSLEADRRAQRGRVGMTAPALIQINEQDD